MSTRLRASSPQTARRKATKKKAAKKKASKKPASKRKATKKKASKKKVAKKKVAKKKVAKKAAKTTTKKKTTKSAPKSGKKDPAKPKKSKAKSDKLTWVSAGRCNNCYDLVYVRGGAETRECTCHSLAVRGEPDKVQIVRGTGAIVRVEMKITRRALKRDMESWSNRYGLIRFPRRRFEDLARDILPLRFGIQPNVFKLDFVAPRSMPEHAPTAGTSSRHQIWVDGNKVWGKVALSTENNDPHPPKPTTSLVQIATLEGLNLYGFRTRITYWRRAMYTVGTEVATGHPEWLQKLPAVQDIVHLDVLDAKEPTEARLRRSLKAKSRLGKFL